MNRTVLKMSLLTGLSMLFVSVPVVNAESMLLDWTSPTKVDLSSVFMLNASDGWAVGSQGTIIRWNGVSWINVTSPTTNNLNSVCMLGASDGWAVGEDGTIVRWDGSQWVAEFPSFLILPLFMTLTLVAVFVYRRKLHRTV